MPTVLARDDVDRGDRACYLMIDIHEMRKRVAAFPDPVHQPERTQQQALAIKPLLEESGRLAVCCLDILATEGTAARRALSRSLGGNRART